VAKLLDANLILGEMFSRKNFEISMREFFDGKESKKILSFSDFFDYEFFKSSWSKDFGKWTKLKLLFLYPDSNAFL
jgi:hypothetical protein